MFTAYAGRIAGRAAARKVTDEDAALAAMHQTVTGRPMNISAPFIARPIATSLLAVAVLLAGLLGYRALPVSALPSVDFPTIQVTTQLPGAGPETVATLITASLERQFGQITGLQSMTSARAARAPARSR